MECTHSAIVVGIAYMRGIDKKYDFRETKNYWICQYGRKYSKKDGSKIGEKYSTSKLDLSSLKIKEQK